MSNFIDEFDRINTPNESLKDSIIDIIESTLVDAPKGRTVSDDAVFQVAERAIVASASLEPDVQYFNAVREVQNFLTLALEGPSANGQMSHTDLLPVGHPSSTAQHDLPVATLRVLNANWVASDPRIKSDEARSIVAAVYSSNPYSVDYAFNIVRLQSLAADEVPVELTLQPLVAFGNPYAGKNSAWHRKMRADRQRRDDEGQFAEMGGGIRFYVRKGSGIYSIVGKVAGIPEDDPNGIDIEVTGVKGFKSGVYTVPSEITHTFKAILPEHAVSNLVPMAKNSNVPFVDMKDLKRKDLPTSWYSTKNAPNVAGLASKATPSRNFETGDGYQASLYNKPDQKLQKRIEEAQQKFGAKVVGQFGTDQLNPDKPVYELVSTKRGQAEVVGYAQDWASVQQLATKEDRDYPDAENEPTSTSTKPAAQPTAGDPDLEDIPAETYEPIDPDANMPEGWGKISDGYYQSEDGKSFATFGPGNLGTAPVYNFDFETGLGVTSYEPIVIPDTFTVYDLVASPLMDSALGVGFSWGDVQDIINSSQSDMPVDSTDPDSWDDVEPSFMEFVDESALDALKQQVKEDSKKFDANAREKQTAEVAVFPGDFVAKKSSGPLYIAYGTHIIKDPAIGELFDDMFFNPQNYSLAEAAALTNIIRETQEENPIKNEKNRGVPAFLGKVTPTLRQILKKALASRVVPEGQEERLQEILGDLYNYKFGPASKPGSQQAVIDEVNTWPWKDDRGSGARTTAKQVANQKGQADPTPEFLISDVNGEHRPSPGNIVKMESLLVNRIIQELIDLGDDPAKNYPNFQEEFRLMNRGEIIGLLAEWDKAPNKPEYTPEDSTSFYTNLGRDGATPRQMRSLERMIKLGFLSEAEIADVMRRLPDLTEPEVGAQFMTVFKERERQVNQGRIDYNVSKGLPIDYILAEEGMSGVFPPKNYVPTYNLDGTPIAGQPAPTSAPTPDSGQPTPAESGEEVEEGEGPLPIKYVFPEDLTYGGPNDPRVVVDDVAKVIARIDELDGFYVVKFDDGSSITYESTEVVTILAKAPETEQAAPEETKEVVQDRITSIHAGTPYDIVRMIDFEILDGVTLSVPDDIGGFVVMAVEAGLPIDRMVLPEWYTNKDAIEAVIRRNNGEELFENKFTLDNYKPITELTPNQEERLNSLVTFFNVYVGTTEFDVEEAKQRIPVTRWMQERFGPAARGENWTIYREQFAEEQAFNLARQNKVTTERTEVQEEFHRELAAEMMKSALRLDLAVLKNTLENIQAGLAEALTDRVITAQGRKLIQGAITDVSLLKPKMTLRNKNRPTPSEVDEVLRTVRDGLIDAGEVHTYGKLNRPSQAMMERLSELSESVDVTIGSYLAGAIDRTPSFMAFEENKNPKPYMDRFDPPAFSGPALEDLRNVDNYKDLVDLLYSKDIYVFDFETTGVFNPIDPEIKNDPIQMAVVKISNGKIDSQFSTYVNPGSKVGSWTLANVGDGQGGRVSSKFLKKQPTKAEAMKMFLDNIPQGSILAGHNGLLFDIEVLNRTLREAGMPEFEVGGFIDTLGLARYMMPEWSHKTPDAPFQLNDYGQQIPSQKLESLVNYFGLSNNGRHEADADVVSTYEVLKNILQRGLDGKAIKGDKFDFQASTNGWDQEKYDFAAEQYKARVATYIANRTLELFKTQDDGDNSSIAEVLLKNTENILEGIAASRNQDRDRPLFMAFDESEIQYPTEEEEAENLKIVDAFNLDVSYLTPEPTEESLRIIKAVILGFNVAVQAYAGSGKTTVLTQIAEVATYLDSDQEAWETLKLNQTPEVRAYLEENEKELRILYAAFNKHNQLEAERVMPGNTTSRTFNSIAYQAQVNADMVARMQADEANLSRKLKPGEVRDRLPIWRNSTRAVRAMFGWTDIVLTNGVKMPALNATGLAVGALNAWILSQDKEITKEHFFNENNKNPFKYSDYQNKKEAGLTGKEDESIFPPKLIRMAKAMWAEIKEPYDPSVSQLLVTYDDTIKNLQLSDPDFAEAVKREGRGSDHLVTGLTEIANLFLIDEAQDLNQSTFDIFASQITRHNNGIQTVVVGDTHQQIYGFRGTMDAVLKFPRQLLLYLSQSFRFGRRIAEFGNKILAVAGYKTDIKGNPKVDSQIVRDNVETLNYLDNKVDVIIARTNFGVLTAAGTINTGAAPVKSGVLLEYRFRFSKYVDTVNWLMFGEKEPSKKDPDLAKFSSWAQLREAAEEDDDPEALGAITMMNQFSEIAAERGFKSGNKLLAYIVASLRAEVPGFSMPEKDPKTKKIPTSGEIGNNLKYEIIGDNLSISDVKYVPDERGKVPTKGTRNNKGMLITEGYTRPLKLDSEGKIIPELDNNGRTVYRYQKPIEPGKDTLESAEKMLQALVDALSGADADVFVTNAHGAKGLEWNKVAIWTDFETPEKHAAKIKSKEDSGEDTSNILPKWKEPEELRLAYTTATRAETVLYTGGIDFFMNMNPEELDTKKKDEQKPSSRPDTSKVEESLNDWGLERAKLDLLTDIELQEKIIGNADAENKPRLKEELDELKAELKFIEAEIAKRADADEGLFMTFEPAGAKDYEAYSKVKIAELEKSIEYEKAQLDLDIEDRDGARTNGEVKEYIESLSSQIADIKADPDYFKDIDRKNLETAKQALAQIITGNLDPRLQTYAQRWSLAGTPGERGMRLGLKAKIEELSRDLGESDGQQVINPMLMAFDAADNISDNEAVTPKPGAPGSDENPIKVDLTEEIKSTNKSNQEVVSTVVASILEAMEKGIIPWKKPWSDEGGFLPTSGATGRVYRGLNLLALMAVGMNREYQGTRWYTKNAISKLGGYVNKREDDKDPGVIITFVSTKKYDKEEQVQVPDPDNPDKTKTETRTITKKFAKMGLDIVYNEDEIQGVELPKIVRKDPPAISEVEGIVLDSYTDKPPIQYMPQDSAYWSPTEDVIRLPLRNQFGSTEEHLDTLFHELTHSTGHQNRLDRKDLLANYGTHKDVRAREELIAEIGSAILAQMMNVNTSIDNVAAYVQSWAEWLKGDPNALHEAASLASKAVEHILGGYWASVDGMVDLSEETEAKEVEAIDMPQGEITGEDGTSGGLGKGVNYRIEGESVILMGNTSKYKDLIKGVGIVPEGKKRPFSFIFHGRNKYWFVTLSGETGLGDRMRILADLKKKLDDENVTPA